jgi:ABC-type branched-subunit amino acid transport system substrate-binding protein
MKSPHSTAILTGAIVLATLVWAGVSYRLINESEHTPIESEQVAGTVDHDHLTIGVIAPLTGKYAQIGQAMREGIELAQLESGTLAEVVFEDTGCDAEEAVNRANKLITQDQVHAIIGDACLDATLATAPIAEQHQVVLVNPTVSDIRLTGAGSYLYRTIPTDEAAGTFTAGQLYSAGHRRLALITDDAPTSLAFRQSLINDWHSLGAIIVSDHVIPAGSSATSNINLTNIDPTADSVLLVAATPESAALLIDQSRVDISPLPLYVNGSFAVFKIKNMTIIRPHQGSADFSNSYTSIYGHAPLPYAAQAYDSFAAITTAYKGYRDSLKPNLDGLNISGVTGPIHFNDLGDIGSNFEVIATTKEGQLQSLP